MAAWDNHKFITVMDYTSEIGKVANTGRPHCVGNLDNSEPFLQVGGSLISANLMCTFSKLPLLFSEKVNFRCKRRYFNVRTPLLGLQLEAEVLCNFMSTSLTDLECVEMLVYRFYRV